MKRLPTTKHVVSIRIAIGAALVLGALCGQTLTNDGMKNNTVCLWRAWITGSSLTETVSTRGATPFWVLKVKPSMTIWSMPDQCKGVEDQAAIKETVESLNRLTWLPGVDCQIGQRASHISLSGRCDQSAEGTFWCRSNRTSSKIRFCVSWHGGNRHKTSQRESADLGDCDAARCTDHVALAWCVRLAGEIISRTVKGADGLTAFQREIQRASHPRAMPAAWGASKKKVQITDKFLDSVFLGIKEGSEEFIVGTPAGCVVCRTGKRRPREDRRRSFLFFNSIRGTPWRLLPDDELREPREPREQPLRIDTSLRVVDRHSGHLHVKGAIWKSDLECEWNVQKRSSKGTTTTAHETWRARCEDGCLVETQTLTAGLMTQVLSHARKIHVYGSVECAQVWCCVYTPSLTRESPLPVSETPWNWYPSTASSSPSSSCWQSPDKWWQASSLDAQCFFFF